MSTILQFIQNKTNLQNNVIYAHTFRDGYLQSTPIMRILPRTLNLSFNTLRISHPIERINNLQISTHAKSSTVHSITNVTSTVTFLDSTAPNSTLTPAYLISNITPELLTSTTQSHTHTRYLNIEILLSKLTKAFAHIINRLILFSTLYELLRYHISYIYLKCSLKYANAIILLTMHQQTHRHTFLFQIYSYKY